MTQILERVATSTIVSLVGGFFLAVTLATSIERAVVIWVLTVISCGVVIGGAEIPAKSSAKRAVLPSFVVSATPVLFFYFLAAIAFMKDPHALDLQIPWHQSVPVHPLDPLLIGGVLALWLVCFLGSLLFVSLSSIASRMLLVGAQKLYKFGPQGIKRVRLIVLGVAAVLAAILSMLSILAK